MYGKVYSSLWDGTLAEPYSRWAVFVFLLAHASPDGVVEMTHEAIARRSCIPADEVRGAIEHLESPDSNSRTPNEDGRRIVPLDGRGWGWQITNYAKYRNLRDADERRRQTREAVARYRKAHGLTSGHGKPMVSRGKPWVSQGKPGQAQAEAEAEALKTHADADASAEAGVALPEKKPEPKATSLSEWEAAFAIWYSEYPRKPGRKAPLKAWKQIRPQTQQQFDLICNGLDRWREHWKTQQTPRDKIPYPATWLNDERWNGDPE